MITVEKYTGSMSYAEAVGGPIQMSILKPTGKTTFKEMCKPFVCKDFLQDAYFAEFVGKPCGIWGFSWKPGILGVQDTYYLALRFGTNALADSSGDIENMLHMWENQFDFPKTKIRETSEPRTKVVEFSAEWVAQPIRISLFSLLLRLGTVYTGQKTIPEFLDYAAKQKTPIADDSGYVKLARSNFDALIENGWPKQTYEQYAPNTHKLHHSSGIVCWDGKNPYGSARTTG